MTRDRLPLTAVLLLALGLRLGCLYWGLPPSTSEVAATDLRCSYALDEDDVLSAAARMRPASLELDPGFYRWGTLHFFLVLPALEAAERLGAITTPWRDAYYNLRPGDFERVYATARLVSVIAGLASIGLAYLVAAQIAGASAGMWAALLVAVSPAHLLASVQARVDLTMISLVTLVAVLGIRAQRSPSQRLWLALGLAAGAAVTAKYVAALLVLPILAAALASHRFPERAVFRVVAGVAIGCLLGEPQLLFRHQQILDQIRQALRSGEDVPAEFRIPALSLLGSQAVNVARFAIGPVAAVLSAAGLWRLWRNRAAGGRMLVAFLATVAVSLVLLRWPLLRYLLPALTPLAAAAAAALVQIPARWRWPIGAAMIAFPLAASVAQIHYMRSPHPANLMLAPVRESVPPGTAIARLIVEMPPLDRRLYPMGRNPLLDDLRPALPLWVLVTDLPDREYPAGNRELLATRFEPVADARLRRILGWATLGERGAPHDWKYTHPSFTLYRRRSL